MAKRFSPFPTADLPDNFAKAVKTFLFRGQPVAAAATQILAPSPEWLAEQAVLYENALNGWKGLKTWKKTRWTLCALSTFGTGDYMIGISGYSGFTLYVGEWLKQKTEAGKQPISPCSARVTDPDASPWNYQP